LILNISFQIFADGAWNELMTAHKILPTLVKQRLPRYSGDEPAAAEAVDAHPPGIRPPHKSSKPQTEAEAVTPKWFQIVRRRGLVASMHVGIVHVADNSAPVAATTPTTMVIKVAPQIPGHQPSS